MKETSGDLSVLGHIKHRLVCTPDFDSMLNTWYSYKEVFCFKDMAEIPLMLLSNINQSLSLNE
jgi:hypothetical protein